MLSSILLNLTGDDLSPVVIRGGVELARRHRARVRGVTVVDTRRMDSLVKECESAAYAVFEQERLERTQTLQGTAHAELAEACLEAQIDFDVRRTRGNPLELLSREARFHDLVVAGYPLPAGSGGTAEPEVSSRELTELLLHGVQPMLVLREPHREVNRILVACDGSPASGRAIKAFFSQDLWPDAEIRLLAIGKTSEQARENLRELAEYAGPRRGRFETGCVRGALRQVLVPYAEKWEADLVVLGMVRRNPILRRLCGETVTGLLRESTAALYVSG